MPKHLPPFAAQYLAAHKQEQQRRDFIAASVPSVEATQQARLASEQEAGDLVRDEEAALAELTQNEPRDPGAERVARGRIEQARKAHATAGEATVAATSVSHGSSVALTRMDDFIISSLVQNNAELKAAKLPVLPKGGMRDIVSAQRDALNLNDKAVESITRALPPKADVHAINMAGAQATVARGQIRASLRGLVLPEMPLAVRPAVGSEVLMIPDAFAIIAALNPEAVYAAVTDAVDRLYADVPESEQLSASDKKKRLAKLADVRFAIELIEVEAVLQAWRDGDFSIGLRPDTTPQAILGIASWRPGEARTGSEVPVVENGKVWFGLGAGA